MWKKIDKFSFFVGAFCVILIIGCIAQVGTTGTEGRYRALTQFEQDPVEYGSGQFFILDTATGTVNRWGATAQAPTVYEFHVVQP